MGLCNKYQSTIVQDNLIKCICKNKGKPSVLMIYNFLIARRNNYDRISAASINFIKEGTGLSTKTIQNGLSFLSQYGYIYKISHNGFSNMYLTPLDDFIVSANYKEGELWSTYMDTIRYYEESDDKFIDYYNKFVVQMLHQIKEKEVQND